MNQSFNIYISSFTGNTRKLAEEVCAQLKQDGAAFAEDDNPQLPNVIIFFWCRKSTMDPKSLEFLSRCKGKQIIAIGTLGAYPDSEYGELVKNNVKEAISKDNICEGVFLSQGKIREESTERRRNLPADHPHHLDDEGLKRHMESRMHPNQEDFANAVRFIKNLK